ncbi:hypothetical protein IC582_016083 [Cucumis melo]
MKLNREKSKGIPSADLLVCFPSRSHLALMPNPLCSPARGSDSSKFRLDHRRFHRRRKSAESPVVWAKAKTMGSEISEPSSPKVTCAGQIKIRPKNSKSWQSVMEEIERIHNRRKLRRRRFRWVESFGFKKDIMQFLTCLRTIRFDFRCFRAFPETDFTTEEEEEEEEEEEDEKNQVGIEENESSRTAFSKWFMVLQENGSNELKRDSKSLCNEDDESIEAIMAPPINALLLMRCRSAPARRWMEEESEEGDDEKEKVKVKKSLKWLMEEENRERLVVEMGTDFCRMTSDNAKEFTRSQSWKV